MKPSLAAYMTTTVPFGYKRNLLEAFTQPIIKDDEFVETLGNDISGRTITGLDSGVTFKFGIRTRYTIGGTVFFSKDRIAFATTD